MVALPSRCVDEGQGEVVAVSLLVVVAEEQGEGLEDSLLLGVDDALDVEQFETAEEREGRGEFEEEGELELVVVLPP